MCHEHTDTSKDAKPWFGLGLGLAVCVTNTLTPARTLGLCHEHTDTSFVAPEMELNPTMTAAMWQGYL